MQDAKTYHQYAADCRRMASTMNVNDGKILLKMADRGTKEQRRRNDSKKLVQKTERKAGLAGRVLRCGSLHYFNTSEAEFIW